MSTLSKDLTLISRLSDENFKLILDIASGDEEKSSIEKILYIESVNEDSKEPSLALFRVFDYIGNTFADARDFEREKIELDEFVSALAQNDSQVGKGWAKLKNSYKELGAFFINKKAESIKSRFSNVTESSITVDARPVFSLDKVSIEKMLFPYILKIDTCDDKTFLCELYPEQLELLEEEIRNAKKKKLVLDDRLRASS